jgi:hypothetical protein
MEVLRRSNGLGSILDEVNEKVEVSSDDWET